MFYMFHILCAQNARQSPAINEFHSWVIEFPPNFPMRFVKLASVLVLSSTASAVSTSCSFQSRTETACSYDRLDKSFFKNKSHFKNFEYDWKRYSQEDLCRD